jgi:hypothetical protein
MSDGLHIISSDDDTSVVNQVAHKFKYMCAPL